MRIDLKALGEIAETQPDDFDGKKNREKLEDISGTEHWQDNMGNRTIFCPIFLGESGERASSSVENYGQTIN